MRRPIEQRDPDEVFERPDPAAEGRLGRMPQCRGSGEVARLDEASEILEPLKVQDLAPNYATCA